MNIEKVVKDGFCTGCGICVSSCRYNAISMELDLREGVYKPLVNGGLCTECKVCLKVCPPISSSPNNRIRGLDLNLDEVMLGPIVGAYVGHSANHEIRLRASSGGVATQILISSLRKGFITGAVVSRGSLNDPILFEPFIADNEEDILSAIGSIYSPVSFHKIIRDILALPESSKIAVVGLPCHIEALEKFERINRKLKKRILFKIGLFCGKCPNYLATKYLVNRFRIKLGSIERIRYRGDGWPGFQKIRLKNGSEIVFPYRSKYAMKTLLSSTIFTPFSCILCPDAVAEMADISLADAWLKEYENDSIGRSLVLTRTGIGEDIAKSISKSGDLILESISVNKVIKAQRRIILSKKRELPARLTILKRLGHNADYLHDVEFLKPNLFSYVRALLIIPIALIIKSLDLNEIVKILPFKLIQVLKIYDKLWR